MDFTRGKLARTLAIIAVFLMLAHPAQAAGLTDIAAPIQTFVAALESALSNLLALIVPHAAPTITIAPAAQPASGTALSAAAVNAATASSAPPLATTSPPLPAAQQPLADTAIPAHQPPPLPSPPAAPNRAPQSPTSILSQTITTNYVTQSQLAAAVAQVQSSVNQQLYSSTSTYADGGIWNAIAASQRINNLSGGGSSPLTISNVTITNPSITGLTASEIPDLSGSYLSLNGGTLTGAFADSGTATSSLAGALGIGTTSPADVLAVNGPIYLANVSPAATSNRLYNNGGALYWNGTALAASSGASTSTANTWSGLQQFANASSSQLSVYGAAYFGATPTSSFNNLGALSLVSNGLTVGGNQLIVSGGNVGIGTTSPGSLLSLGSLANFTTATSTFYSTGGINLAAGCFAVGGTCVSGGQPDTIDATQSAGVDMCAKISAAATALATTKPGGGTIDARGFTGIQSCAGSMFANWPTNFSSTVLLGAVQIQTAVPQNPPTHTALTSQSPWGLRAPTYTAIGTVIQPANTNSFENTHTTTAQTTSGATLPFGSTSGIAVGDSVTGANIPAHTTVMAIVPNTSITMGENVTGTIANGETITFTHPIMSLGNSAASSASGVQTSNLRISCLQPNGTPLTGGIGWQNDWAQQGSPSSNIDVDGCYTAFDIESNSISQPQNGGPYDDFGVGMNGLNTAAATCMKVGNATYLTQTQTSFNNFSCGGQEDLTEPTVGVYVDGQVSFYTPNMENVVTGFLIASLRSFGGVSIISPLFNGGNYTMTNAIVLSSAQGLSSGEFLDLEGYGGDGVTNRIVDQVNSRTITAPRVAYYIIGNNGSVLADGAPSILSGGLTISGGATTSGTTYFPGGGVWSSGGNVGIGTTSPGSLLSLGSLANFTMATSTFYSAGGINLAAGCFAINSACLGLSNLTGTLGVGSGGTGATSFGQGWIYSDGISGVLAASTSPTVSYITATSTTATSTIASGGFAVGTNKFVIQQTSGDVIVGSNTALQSASANYATLSVLANGAPEIQRWYSSDGSVSEAFLDTSGNLALSGALSTGLTGSGQQVEASFKNTQAAAPGVGSLIAFQGTASGNTMAEVGSSWEGSTNATSSLVFITRLGGALSEVGRFTGEGNFGLGTTNPYSRLQVSGQDSASSTSAFAVVNSASTTLFAVFDGGNAQLSGTLTQSSDQRLKTNIQSLDGSSSLVAINQLNPVTFTWMNPSQGSTPQLGFIAQQVQQIFPQLVSTTSPTALTPNGTLGLNYIGLISPIVAAIQALYADVLALQQTVAGFATNFVSAHITVTTGDFQQLNTQDLCVGSTCVTPQQFQAMVAAAGALQSAGNAAASLSDIATSSDEEATDTPPVIQVNGANPATINVGATYQDLGATIEGPQADRNLGIQASVDGGATTTIDAIDINTSDPGTHTIEYVATDQNGLEGTATRTVDVIAPAASTQTPAATSTDPSGSNSGDTATTTEASSTAQ